MAETILCNVDENCSQDEYPDLVQEAQESLVGFQLLYQRWLSPVYRYFIVEPGIQKMRKT